MNSRVTFSLLGSLCAVLLFTGLVGTLRTLFACDVAGAVVEMMGSWPRDQYLLIYFQSDDGAVSETGEAVQRAVQGYGRRVNVKLVPASSGRWGGERAPAVLVSPRGAVLACFDGPAAADEVRTVFESPGRRALVEGLKKNDAVILCLLDPKSDVGRNTVSVIKAALRLVRDLTEFSTELLVVDPSSPEEKYLAQNVYAHARNPEQRGTEPAVALVCANGRVADVTFGVPTEEQCIDRLQRIYRMGGYVAPSQFGEDLLLVW